MNNSETAPGRRVDARALQFVKYCLVGGLNTVVTFVVIFVCKALLGVNPYVSNALGYVAGVINSFVWNKQWVFRSKGRYRSEAVRFVVGFAVCYALQFAAVWALNQSDFGKLRFDIHGFVISGYGIATIIGNILYTLANFVYNRLVTFKG